MLKSLYPSTVCTCCWKINQSSKQTLICTSAKTTGKKYTQGHQNVEFLLTYPPDPKCKGQFCFVWYIYKYNMVSRLHTCICWSMFLSWTRNSLASLALSETPFRAWESWHCNTQREAGYKYKFNWNVLFRFCLTRRPARDQSPQHDLSKLQCLLSLVLKLSNWERRRLKLMHPAHPLRHGSFPKEDAYVIWPFSMLRLLLILPEAT